MCTALVLLAVSPPEPLCPKDLAIPGVIMIGRERTMSARREWAAALGGSAHKVEQLLCSCCMHAGRLPMLGIAAGHWGQLLGCSLASLLRGWLRPSCMLFTVPSLLLPVS